jgi:hypothetical protein
MPQLASPTVGREAVSWLEWVGFAFPERPQPLGLVPLEVWLLVHWVPPGKNVRDPKLVSFPSQSFLVYPCLTTMRCSIRHTFGEIVGHCRHTLLNSTPGNIPQVVVVLM